MIIYSLLLIGTSIYLILRYIYSYWDRHGLPNLKPDIPFGNIRAVALKQESFGVALNALHAKTTGQLVGIYLLFRPAILIRDAHLAHRIITSDFNYFHDRGVHCDESSDPFSAHLFALPGKRWRSLRNKLTPTFTAGQLRGMLPTILAVGRKFQGFLEPKAKRGEVIEARDLISRFVLEIVASVFFGYEINSIHDPQDSFRTVLRSFREDNHVTNLRTVGAFLCPTLLKVSRVKTVPEVVDNFVNKIIREQIEFREKNNVTRKDFIQLLIDLRREKSDFGLSLEQCAANVFLFYVAGADTSTDAITYTVHELTHRPDLMKKVQAEIDDALEKSNGEINYDVLHEMKLLDNCVKETLRKYPFPILNRECTQDYQVPDSKLIIRKGTPVIIPLQAFGMSEEYFPEPNRYLPERFDSSTKNYDEKAYIPFGDGPRNCIGSRMGSAVSKIGIIMLLSKFNFEATQGAEIGFARAQIALAPENGISLKISNRIRNSI
ncbi:cytochrome P450 6d3 [Culex quinquefasciatus]|uniref:CYP6Z16 n=1 Tax=Culex quinquefasciatus TaxID=7176 RepID=A0A4D6IVX2_CULQU|nr:cytochrome P450 6d3 [Culex quinquefasciatus]QCC72460.1 CYP6Z16 [Culex quinquefasciatus]